MTHTIKAKPSEGEANAMREWWHARRRARDGSASGSVGAVKGGGVCDGRGLVCGGGGVLLRVVGGESLQQPH